MGGRIHDAMRLLLYSGRGPLRVGGRLPSLYGHENVPTDLRAGKRLVAGCGHRERPVQPDGLHHPSQPGKRRSQRGIDEQYCVRIDQGGHVRRLDHAQYRHGQGRAVAFETNIGVGGVVRRQRLQRRQGIMLSAPSFLWKRELCQKAFLGGERECRVRWKRGMTERNVRWLLGEWERGYRLSIWKLRKH